MSQKTFIKSEKQLSIVFDLDGCLLDKKYNFTVPLHNILEIIGKAKDSGMSVHINSNRSILSIKQIYETLNLNGMVIGECGSVIYDPNTENRLFYAKKVDRSYLSQKLDKVTSKIEYIDTDMVISSPASLAKQLAEGSLALFLEQTRECTMTMYPRRVLAGTLDREEDIEKFLFDYMKEEYEDYNVRHSIGYGNVQILPKGINKAIPLSLLTGKIISFGDTEQDIPMLLNSEYCGCPLNATENVKNTVNSLGGYIANKPFTEGAMEFFRLFIFKNGDLEKCHMFRS